MILIATDMSFRILLLVAAVLRISSGKRYLPCEYEYLHKCDLGFVVDFDNHPNDPNMTVYCDVFQHLVDCLSSSAQCKGEFIDSVRFMILQYTIVDKTLELRPSYNLEALQTIVQADEKYRLHIEHLSGVGKDDFAPCAARIHVRCATQGQQDMENGVKTCSSIENFIRCYENPEKTCTAQIYRDFINLFKMYASQLLEIYPENPGVMPDC